MTVCPSGLNSQNNFYYFYNRVIQGIQLWFVSANIRVWSLVQMEFKMTTIFSKRHRTEIIGLFVIETTSVRLFINN
jgi:hypothetical protein